VNHFELLIGGHPVGGVCDQSIGKQVMRSPFSGQIVGTAAEGGESELKACIDAATEAFSTWRHSSRAERVQLLRSVASVVRLRSEELVGLLIQEIGKPRTWARGEVWRLALTFDYAADAVADFGTEAIPLDLDSRGADYTCTSERFPRGPIFCLVPYNWPFNLSAHKIAPALATGNTVVVKTSPLAPICTLALVRLIQECGAPPGVINAWNGADRHVLPALADPRVKMLSFTGSAKVGWMLKKEVWDRPVALELGGDGFVVVDKSADLDWAVKRITAGGYGYAGQVCIAVQHVLVHESIYEDLRLRLIAATEACPTGDPESETTVCGPLISSVAADKVEAAISSGGKILAGGGRNGNVLSPTLLEETPPQSTMAREEVFGPAVDLAPFGSADEAIERVNRSQYGIHLGLFSGEPATVERFYREVETGGLVVNDYPTLRFDNVPYGGVKRSGFGREGVRYAMFEMTEPKSLVSKRA